MLTRNVAILIAATTAWHGVAAAKMMSKMVCYGVSQQNACKGQDICINDPRGLPKDLILSLSLITKQYSIGELKGKITSINDEGNVPALIIDPAFEGGNEIEFLPTDSIAKLSGGEDNYFFKCRKTLR